jgi:hypothetical protein
MWLELCPHSIGDYVVVVVVVRVALVLWRSTDWLDNCDDTLRSFIGVIIIYWISGRGHLYSLHTFLYLFGNFFVAHFYTYSMENHYLESHCQLASFQALAQGWQVAPKCRVVTRDVIMIPWVSQWTRTISSLSAMVHFFSYSSHLLARSLI